MHSKIHGVQLHEVRIPLITKGNTAWAYTYETHYVGKMGYVGD